MKCRKCGHGNKDGDWVCSRCEYVLDTAFLGADILNERTSDGIVDEPAPTHTHEELNFGGDSLILGRLGADDAAIESILTDRTAGFLEVQSDASAPAAVYITAEISRLIVPGRVLRHTSDGNARRDMLSAFELAVFELIDGVRTLADVQEEAGLSHNDLCIAVAMLHDKAVVEAAPVVRSKKKAPAPVLANDAIPIAAIPAPLPASPPALTRTSTPPARRAPPPAAQPVPAKEVELPVGVVGLPGTSRPAMVAPALRPRGAATSATAGTAGSGLRVEPPLGDAKQRAANHYDMCMKDLAAGRVSRAWGYAKLAAEADPHDPKYAELLAEWHKRQGSHGELASTPQELMASAQEAENKGDVEKAVVLLKRICEIAPKSAAAHNKLAVLLATKLRQFKPAYDAAIKAVELEPGNMSYQSNMMKILAKVDDVDRPKKADSGGLLGRFLKR